VGILLGQFLKDISGTGGRALAIFYAEIISDDGSVLGDFVE
jgi:hypothetical protein